MLADSVFGSSGVHYRIECQKMRRTWEDGDALAGLVNGLHINSHKHQGAPQRNGWHGGHQHAAYNTMNMMVPPGYINAYTSTNGDQNVYAVPLASTIPMNGPMPGNVAGPNGMNNGYAAIHHNMGWGGQAIHENSGFKAPWFGKTKGGNNNTNNNGRNNSGRNGGRGSSNNRHNNNHNNGSNQRQRGPRRNWNGNFDDNSPPDEGDDSSIEAIIQSIQKVPRGSPIPDSVYQSLFRLEGRSCALLLKELSKVGLSRRAVEIFDWLRKLGIGHPLRNLLDVFSYTASISLCIPDHNVDRAVALAAEMRSAGVERNVHTYTALMNVCIKCSKYQMALETYRLMRADGCPPNVVTYNTLIDVFGKTGAWEDAVGVLSMMKGEGVEPVLRTYNTLIIACNMCNQPREAIDIHRRMVEEGHSPNSTTYNALISAYGKANQLDKVMEVFQEMLCRGCERSVITYSSLISACEKAGQWELAMELFKEMLREQCAPNTVTYNSLITALAQGAQWKRATEVFEQMPGQRCTPDVVTYTALISAYEKGGQWRLALQAFERMKAQGCPADAIVYNAIVDALWETGVVWAQRQALLLFRGAVEEGHFLQARLVPGLPRAEVNLHAMTAGVAKLSLYAWLMSLRQLVLIHGKGAMPLRVAIVTDRGKGAKEQGNLVVREAVAAIMLEWGGPLCPLADSGYSGMLEGGGADTAEWLLNEDFEARLFSFFPCTDILPSIANENSVGLLDIEIRQLTDEDGSKELSIEARCSEAFAAVCHFEKTHCLALQNMGYVYLQRRNELVAQCLDLGQKLQVKEEATHDAILLMDRVMSTSLQLQSDLLDLLAVACLSIAIRQSNGQLLTDGVGDGGSSIDPGLEAATGLPPAAVERMEWNISQVLQQDTSAISTLRCLELYFERMGGTYLDSKASLALAGRAEQLTREALCDMAFLNCRPSVIAAALMYVERRARGCIPFWPSMLAKLTGYQDMSTPELSVAIKAAQRMCGRSGSINLNTALSSSINSGGGHQRPSSRKSNSSSMMALRSLSASPNSNGVSLGVGPAGSLSSTLSGLTTPALTSNGSGTGDGSSSAGDSSSDGASTSDAAATSIHQTLLALKQVAEQQQQQQQQLANNALSMQLIGAGFSIEPLSTQD